MRVSEFWLYIKLDGTLLLPYLSVCLSLEATHTLGLRIQEVFVYCGA